MSNEIHGFCDERFQPLKEAFAANFEDGLELGASLCLMEHGRPVVDLWGGWANLRRTRPWEADTVVVVASARVRAGRQRPRHGARGAQPSRRGSRL